MKSYRDLFVWQKGMDLVENIYILTRQFPTNEQYGLISQMRRSAVSIPSNIAEGRYRGSRKDFKRFLVIAYGSGAELETQLEIAKRLKFTDRESGVIEQQLSEVMKMLNTMIFRLSDVADDQAR